MRGETITRKHNPNWHDPPEAQARRKAEERKRQKLLMEAVDKALAPIGLTHKQLLNGVADRTIGVYIITPTIEQGE